MAKVSNRGLVAAKKQKGWLHEQFPYAYADKEVISTKNNEISYNQQTASLTQIQT